MAGIFSLSLFCSFYLIFRECAFLLFVWMHYVTPEAEIPRNSFTFSCIVATTTKNSYEFIKKIHILQNSYCHRHGYRIILVHVVKSHLLRSHHAMMMKISHENKIILFYSTTPSQFTCNICEIFLYILSRLVCALHQNECKFYENLLLIKCIFEREKNDERGS